MNPSLFKSAAVFIFLTVLFSCSQKQFAFRQKLKADKKPPATAQARLLPSQTQINKKALPVDEIRSDTLAEIKSEETAKQHTDQASAIPHQKEDLIPFHPEQLSPDEPEKQPEKSQSLPRLKLEMTLAVIGFILLLLCPALLIVFMFTEAYLLATLAVILGLTGVLWWLIALIARLEGRRLLTAGVLIAASLVVLLFIISVTWGMLFDIHQR